MCLQGRDQQEPSHTEQLFCFGYTCGLPHYFSFSNTRNTKRWPGNSCFGARGERGSLTAAFQAPSISRTLHHQREGEREKGMHRSCHCTKSICPDETHHQYQLLHLFFSASIQTTDCSIQISKALKKFSCVLPAPSPTTVGIRTSRRGKKARADICRWLLTYACSHFHPDSAPEPK